MSQISICIIDDHKIVREGLVELIQKLGDLEVIYQFESGETFLDAIPLKQKPDLYILDYSMQNINGIEVLKILDKKEEEYKVLLLTQHFDEEIINLAYHFGARGFLNKNCTAQELKFAIDKIVTIGYNNVSEILKRVKNYDTSCSITKNNSIVLSPREHEFLTLVCAEEEFTYEQMSDQMGLSVKSLESYRANLFARYKIKSKVGLVLFSFNNKLTEPFL
jgi:DNA-binding NarL/FixJ family response regulator